MSLLFINENGAVVGLEENRCVVRYSDGMQRLIPIENLESITIMGNVQITTQCVKECLTKGITISYFSKGGTYFGRLHSTGHVNTRRQRKQCELYEKDFSIEFSKRVIKSKLKNQGVVLRRYEKSKNIPVSDSLKMIEICRSKIETCCTIPELMGYEGQGAKAYFEGLSKVIKPEFKFSGRNKRPPRDEFNSMISLGYSIILNEIYGVLESKGLNPYFGFMHRDKEKHPTLASDMMEEWRAVIVDSTVMSMINGNEIQKEDFLMNIEEPGCFLTKNGIKLFLDKLEKKLQTEIRYLDYMDYPVSFRRGISLQVEKLAEAVEAGDASIYRPIEIR